MKTVIAAVALALGLLIGPVSAETPAVDCAPWVKATKLLGEAMPDLNARGIRGMSLHVRAFEDALAAMDPPCDRSKDKNIVVLTDGMMDTMVMLTSISKTNPGKDASAVANPYPVMALYLASYYNEVRRFDDALRVLEFEKAHAKSTFGQTRPSLTSERAVALGQLHRLPEALAAYDEGLKLGAIDDVGKARMHRGRGFILTEMERLDEAEAAYRESLKFDPNSALAKRELEYIAKLKIGGQKAPVGAPILSGPDKKN